MEKNRFIVIMAGGRGERFWPRSRTDLPKQFLPIVGDQPLLVQTLRRLQGVVPPENLLVLTNREQRPQVLALCPDLPPENVVGEPVGRDTAPAVALANLLVQQRRSKATFAMLPADHVIKDVESYQSVLHAAFTAAEENEALVTIGIQPEHPATGYGYIRRGEKVTLQSAHSAHKVLQFVEKPDRPTAEQYLKSGEYFWNAGMFIWRTEVLAAQFQSQAPEISEGMDRIAEALAAEQPLDAVLDEHYPSLKKISVDYAILENAPEVIVVESAFDWDDVGEWPAVARHFPKDDHGNVTGPNAIVESGKNNIVFSEKGRLTAVLGVDDLIVVQTEDATLVCPRSKAQDIKKLVAKLAKDPNTAHWV